MEKQINPLIDDTYWVEPGQLLAGRNPCVWESKNLLHKLHQFLHANVTFFIDLTEEGEYGTATYDTLLNQTAKKLGLTAVHQRIPIRDLGVPDPAQMKYILDSIDNAISDGHTVYVHCHGGIGRTGTVIGCYLVRHGLSGTEALIKLTKLRQGTALAQELSPVTLEQRQRVLTWEIST